jgi:hypothetical protein
MQRYRLGVGFGLQPVLGTTGRAGPNTGGIVIKLSVRGFSENFSNKRQFRENRLSVP